MRVDGVGAYSLVPGPLDEDSQVGVVREDAVTAAAGPLREDSDLHEARHQVVRGGVTRLDRLADASHGEKRLSEQAFEHAVAVRCRAAQFAGDEGAVALPEGEDTACGLDRALAYLRNGEKEELDPFFPLAVVADRLKPFVVLGAVPLEEPRQVEHRLLEDLRATEQQGDQQAADPAVAVAKRVDRFELGVREADSDQGRRVGRVLSQVGLERIQSLPNLARRRWYEGGLPDR